MFRVLNLDRCSSAARMPSLVRADQKLKMKTKCAFQIQEWPPGLGFYGQFLYQLCVGTTDTRQRTSKYIVKYTYAFENTPNRAQSADAISWSETHRERGQGCRKRANYQIFNSAYSRYRQACLRGDCVETDRQGIMNQATSMEESCITPLSSSSCSYLPISTVICINTHLVIDM